MKCNMGSADRVIRVLIALILGALYLTDSVTGTIGVLFAILALVFLVTSALGFCPLYVPFKISTTRKTPDETK